MLHVNLIRRSQKDKTNEAEDGNKKKTIEMMMKKKKDTLREK